MEDSQTLIHVISRIHKRKDYWSKRVYTSQTWAVRIEGAKGISKMFYGKRLDACFWAAGRLLQAGGGQLIVHDKNGEVTDIWEIKHCGSKAKVMPND